ncbi:MAG: DUF2334 domain-containing protein [Fibrobacterales bacterium]
MSETALLSFHDITINNFITVESFLNAIDQEGEYPCALLITPFINESIDPGLITSFAQWLTKRHSLGHEIFIHGYTHTADPHLKRTLWGRFKNKINNHEAEFAGLDSDDTTRVLMRALAAYTKLHRGPVSGFVPPTWFDSPTLKQECFNSSLPIYESRFAIHNLEGSTIKTTPMSWFRSPILFILGTLYIRCRLLFPIHRPLRIALHPQDIETNGKLKLIRSLLITTGKKCGFSPYSSLFNR